MAIYKIYRQVEIDGQKKYVAAVKCKSRQDAEETAKIMDWHKFYVMKITTSHTESEYSIINRKMTRSPKIYSFQDFFRACYDSRDVLN